MNSYANKKPVAFVVVKVSSSKIHNILKKRILQKDRIRVNFGDIVIHAIVSGLKKFPEFNSNFVKKIEIFDYINVGYFINVGKGSRIAVIENAGKKNLFEISSQIKRSAIDYIHDKLKNDAYKSTIFVTNLSPFNCYMAAAPLFEYNSAVISISSEHESWKNFNGKPIPVKMFNISLSFDARVADCQRALQFLNTVKSILEEKNN